MKSPRPQELWSCTNFCLKRGWVHALSCWFLQTFGPLNCRATTTPTSKRATRQATNSTWHDSQSILWPVPPLFRRPAASQQARVARFSTTGAPSLSVEIIVSSDKTQAGGRGAATSRCRSGTLSKQATSNPKMPASESHSQQPLGSAGFASSCQSVCSP